MKKHFELFGYSVHIEQANRIKAKTKYDEISKLILPVHYSSENWSETDVKFATKIINNAAWIKTLVDNWFHLKNSVPNQYLIDDITPWWKHHRKIEISNKFEAYLQYSSTEFFTIYYLLSDESIVEIFYDARRFNQDDTTNCPHGIAKVSIIPKQLNRTKRDDRETIDVFPLSKEQKNKLDEESRFHAYKLFEYVFDETIECLKNNLGSTDYTKLSSDYHKTNNDSRKASYRVKTIKL